MAEQTYQCKQCGHEWSASGAAPGPAACPVCGSGPPFTVIMPPMVAHGTSSASLTLSVPRILDGLRLTVLGVLLSIGLTVGLSVGFGVGGWAGVASGLGSGPAAVMLLVLAFRRPRSRDWLAGIADRAIGR